MMVRKEYSIDNGYREIRLCVSDSDDLLIQQGEDDCIVISPEEALEFIDILSIFVREEMQCVS